MNPNKPENLNQENNIEQDQFLNKERPVNGERKESEQNKAPEKYLPVELEQNLQNNPLPQAQTQNPQTQTDNTQQPSVDPVQQVKTMISAGYTPSLDLIQNASSIIKTDNTDYSNLWFAVLLQKLIREYNK